MPRLVDLLRLPVTVLPGKASNHFPVVTIEDCVDAIVRAVQNDASIGRAYNVSGEYCMIKAAARNGWLDKYSASLSIKLRNSLTFPGQA